MEGHIREHWKRYLTWILYAILIGSIISAIFVICLFLAFIAHGQISRGLDIHYTNVDFDMEMIRRRFLYNGPTFVPQICEYGNFSVRKVIFTL